jgi:hypothetical protein
MARFRLAFWLRAMDVANALTGFSSPLYLWTVKKASDCVDWEGER